MKRLASVHLFDIKPGVVIDIGSMDVNGSYRPIFEKRGWKYIGLDLQAGANVDMVLADPYRIAIEDASVDLVVSGQAFEHIQFFWVTFTEIVRVLRPGGLFFLIAPSRGPEHRYPVDCWRFYPDGYRALAAWGKVDVVEVKTDWQATGSADESAVWGDTVGVFRKP
jgi:SAM-dependent methyltransferase